MARESAAAQRYTVEAASASEAVIASLLYALQLFSLYPDDHPLGEQGITRLHKDLDVFTAEYGDLFLRVEKNQLLLGEEVVYQGAASEGDLTFALSRDGILILVVRRGINREEVQLLISILNRYKTIWDESDGDIVTALWEADLPHIDWKAVDAFIDSDIDIDVWRKKEKKRTPVLDSGLDLVSAQKPEPLPRINMLSVQLTPEETEQLKEMVQQDEERDLPRDILDMMADILTAQQEEDYCSTALAYIDKMLVQSLSEKDFDFAAEILQRVILLRQLGERRWLHSVLSTMDALLEKISSSYFLVPLIHSLGTFNGASTDSIKKFLSLVPSRAISALAPLLWTSVPSHVHSMIAETVVLLANRTFEPFEALLVSAEDEHLIRMVPLLGKMQGERSAGVLLRLVKHSSDKVRKEALKAIIVRAIWAPEDLMPLMDDENESVRQIFLRYMQSRRCETVEEGLLWYLQTHGFREEEHEHLLECFRTLGKCGSAQSLGFLRQLLLGGNWFSRLRATVRRQGAALALSELGLDEARKILAEAIHSRYPGIRKAAWAFNNLPAAGGN